MVTVYPLQMSPSFRSTHSHKFGDSSRLGGKNGGAHALLQVDERGVDARRVAHRGEVVLRADLRHVLVR